MTPGARTQDEIVARIENIDPTDDWMATRRETLIGFLDFECARPYIKPETTAEQWAPDVDPIAKARDYLAFAIDKAAGHRGLSAMRSIDHYREWAWLSADDAFTAALDRDYPPYGAPILRAIAEAIGAADTTWRAHSTAELERMTNGLPCKPSCTTCLGRLG